MESLVVVRRLFFPTLFLAAGCYAVGLQLSNKFYLSALSTGVFSATLTWVSYRGWFLLSETMAPRLLLSLGLLLAVLGAVQASEVLDFKYGQARSDVSNAIISSYPRCVGIGRKRLEATEIACAIEPQYDFVPLALVLIKIIYLPPLIGFVDTVAGAEIAPSSQCLELFNEVYKACPGIFSGWPEEKIQSLTGR